MPYRMVTNVGKQCGRLAGAARQHAERIVSSLTERWQNRLADGEELTVRKMLALLAEDLQTTHDQLIEVEDSLRSELREDKLGRGVRNRSVSYLRELLFDVKKVCDAHYGPGSAEILFDEDSEDVPTEANEVFRVARRARRNMTDPSFPMPPLKHGVAPDFAGLGGRFDGPLEDLEVTLKELHDATQGSSAKIADKERDLGDFERFAGRSGRFLESITSLSGHGGVARRIRRSRHRARAGLDDVDEPDDVEPNDIETEAVEPGEDAAPDRPPETEDAVA